MYMQDGERVFNTDFPEFHPQSVKLSNKEGEAKYIQQISKSLKESIKPDSMIYVIERSVSRSGLTSRLSFYGKDKDGQLFPLDHSISVLTGYKQRAGGSRGLEVHGYGFNKAVQILDTLAYALYGKDVQFRNTML